ncbi:MAG: AzlD domain-containing protein [Treponema sp.]|jgi:branched-subunit amino acid transport protein AzlD|nr:AzlD domain-containing protein [Treponema sp.]
MKLSVSEALIMAAACGAVIFFCRSFPFLFFAGNSKPLSRPANVFLEFIERIAPPAAMTVLTFNILGLSLWDPIMAWIIAPSSVSMPNDLLPAFAVFCASVITALLHIWKRNPLISIFGGTAIYMILQKIWL